MKTKYKRVLLKLSGEYLGGSVGHGFDFSVISALADQIIKIQDLGVEVAIVLGGGNFFRGTKNIPLKMDRVAADHIGMMATVMNAVCLKEALIAKNRKAQVMTGLEAPGVAEKFEKQRAVSLIEAGNILIFGGGTGNPYFSTDTAAVLRGLEISADIVIKGTKVDGIYDKDPVEHPTAQRFDDLSYAEVLNQDLKVMDGAAIALCRENRLPLCVLSIVNPDDLFRFVQGEDVGSIVHE
jgi:uridylate kinase